MRGLAFSVRASSVLASTLALLGACGTPAEKRDPPVAFAKLSPDRVKHGERLAIVLGCSGCHGKDLAGQDWSEDGYGRLWTANLTVAAAGYSDAQLESVIRSGKKPDGTPLWDMPSNLFTQLADADMAALIAYIRSRPAKGAAHPPPTFGPILKAEMAKGTYYSSAVKVEREGKAWPPDAGPQHRLARYMVRATCAECHEMNLRGGKSGPVKAERPDIRIAASYESGDFARLLRTGVPAGERKLGLMGEVARGRYSHFTDAEIAAIHAYLKAVAERDP
ncbi:c-type cytochrome [Sphingopyxis sp.]|uniref:c-type cytochrome n=1 Tax=Sphingopyxis sp. TaxID=1908224 RepID=UPI003BA9BB5C